MYLYFFLYIFNTLVNNSNGDMMEDKYVEIVNKHTPKEDRLKNAIMTFIFGGLFGVLAELLLRGYVIWFNLPRKEAGVVVTLTLVVVASLLTALGVFDVCVSKLKSALIIPITGFANSIVSAALEFQTEGRILGTAAQMFTLAGPVIVFGCSSAAVYGLIIYFFGLY